MSISLNPTLAPAAGLNVAETAASTKPAGVDPGKSEKAQAAIEKFEGLFMSMMIKQLRETSFGDGMFPGDPSDTYGGMFDMYLGDHLASAGNIGLERLFNSSSAVRELENFADPRDGSTSQSRLKGIEAYHHEQLRSGTVGTLPAP